jgi:hypothetical protein
MIAVQSAFRLEMYQNNIFFIFLKLFLISAHQNLKIYIKKFNKKKSRFKKIRFIHYSQTDSISH